MSLRSMCFLLPVLALTAACSSGGAPAPTPLPIPPVTDEKSKLALLAEADGDCGDAVRALAKMAASAPQNELSEEKRTVLRLHTDGVGSACSDEVKNALNDAILSRWYTGNAVPALPSSSK